MKILGTHRFHRVAMITVIVVFLHWIACVFTICLLHLPVALNWDMSLDDSCGNVTVIEISLTLAICSSTSGSFFFRSFESGNCMWCYPRNGGITVCFALGLILVYTWILQLWSNLYLSTTGMNLSRLVQTLKCLAHPDPPFCPLESLVLVMAEMIRVHYGTCVPTLGPLFFLRSKTSAYGRQWPGLPETISSKPIYLKNFRRNLGCSEGWQPVANKLTL